MTVTIAPYIYSVWYQSESDWNEIRDFIFSRMIDYVIVKLLWNNRGDTQVHFNELVVNSDILNYRIVVNVICSLTN